MLRATLSPEAQHRLREPDRPTTSFDLNSCSSPRPSQVVRIARLQYSVDGAGNGGEVLWGTLRVTL